MTHFDYSCLLDLNSLKNDNILIQSLVDFVKKYSPENDWSFIYEEPKDVNVNSALLYAKDGDRIIGIVRYYNGTIFQLLVHVEYRSLGIGRKLITCIINLIKKVYRSPDIGLWSLTVELIPYYEKLNFKKTNTVNDTGETYMTYKYTNI